MFILFVYVSICKIVYLCICLLCISIVDAQERESSECPTAGNADWSPARAQTWKATFKGFLRERNTYDIFWAAWIFIDNEVDDVGDDGDDDL